jgi:hypothetical protein
LPPGDVVSVVQGSDGKRWHRIVRRGRVDRAWRTVHDVSLRGEVRFGALHVRDDRIIYLEGVENRVAIVGSADKGSKWSTIGEVVETEVYDERPSPSEIAIAPDGETIAVASRWIPDEPGSEHWIIGRWGNRSWTTLDDFQLFPERQTRPNALVIGPNGTIWAAGFGMTETGSCVAAKAVSGRRWTILSGIILTTLPPPEPSPGMSAALCTSLVAWIVSSRGR